MEEIEVLDCLKSVFLLRTRIFYNNVFLYKRKT